MAPSPGNRRLSTRLVGLTLVLASVTSGCASASSERDIRDPYLERLRALSNEAINVMAEVDGPLRRGSGSEELLLIALADVRAPQRLAIVADKVGSLDPPPGFIPDHEVVVAAFRRLRDAGRDLDGAIAATDVGRAVVALVVLRDIIRQTAISVTPETCGSVTPGGGYGLCDPIPSDPWEAAVFQALLSVAARYDVLAGGHTGLSISDDDRAVAAVVLHPTAILLLEAAAVLLDRATPAPERSPDHEALLDYLAVLGDIERRALEAAVIGDMEAFDAIRAEVTDTTCATRTSLSATLRSFDSGWFDDPDGVCLPTG